MEMPVKLGRARMAGIPRAIRAAEEAIARRIANTEARNAAFRALPADKKRVAIARDVIKYLNSKKFLMFGTWSQYIDGENMPSYYTEGAREVVNGGQCQVCAVGGIVAAAVERGECGGTLYPIKLDDDGEPKRRQLLGGDEGSTDIHNALAGIFTYDQLCLIEAAFEGEHCPSHTRTTYHGCDIEKGSEFAPWKNALAFGQQVEEDAHGPRPAKYTEERRATMPARRETRMRAIMRNIIANKGTFVP